MEQNLKFIELRKSEGLTQTEFARKLNISRSTVADIERGSIPISKRVKQRIVQNLGVESGIIDSEIRTEKPTIRQVSESGLTQENDNNIENKNKKGFQLFPNDYWTNENFYLKQNFEKKLLLDIVHNYPNINELIDDLNTLKIFEFIIGNLNKYYFNSIVLQFYSASKYLKNGKFDYDQFKLDYLKEVENIEEIRPALSKIAAAINTFYEEIKAFDKENIITGYFGNQAEIQ